MNETKCDHPKNERESYHDHSVVCNKCNCVIEQYGESLAEPSYLGAIKFPEKQAKSTREIDLEQQNEALLAQVAELQKYLWMRINQTEAYIAVEALSGNEPKEMAERSANAELQGVLKAIKITPQQSLDSIKAAVEAETIDRCAVASWMAGMDEQTENVMRKTHPRDTGSMIAREIRSMPRKYQLPTNTNQIGSKTDTE
jgi:hypothetical protein